MTEVRETRAFVLDATPVGAVPIKHYLTSTAARKRVTGEIVRLYPVIEPRKIRDVVRDSVAARPDDPLAIRRWSSRETVPPSLCIQGVSLRAREDGNPPAVRGTAPSYGIDLLC